MLASTIQLQQQHPTNTSHTSTMMHQCRQQSQHTQPHRNSATGRLLQNPTVRQNPSPQRTHHNRPPPTSTPTGHQPVLPAIMIHHRPRPPPQPAGPDGPSNSYDSGLI